MTDPRGETHRARLDGNILHCECGAQFRQPTGPSGQPTLGTFERWMIHRGFRANLQPEQET